MYYNDFKGERISALGLGALRLPMDKDNPKLIDRVEGQKIVDAAIEGGINFFDTAYTYQDGDSERFLGEALAKYPRDSYYISTKYNAVADPDIEREFNAQLKSLRTEYFDFYLLHGMDDKSFQTYTDKEKDYIGFLRKKKEEGVIRYLGFSTHANPHTLSKFLHIYDGYDMAIMQLNYLDWTALDARGQYELLSVHGIPVFVMEPLKGGRLATLNPEALDILKDAGLNDSPASYGMRFLQGLYNVKVVLSGMSTLEQLQDNIATFSERKLLSGYEASALHRAKDAFVKNMGVPCSSCRYCCKTCPSELNIPVIIKAYNEYGVSKDFWRVAEFDLEKGPAGCIGCGQCLKHCPQNIDIPAVMKNFREALKAAEAEKA